MSLYTPASDGDQMEGKPQTSMTERLPRTVRYARILIGIQIFRLIGLAFVIGLRNGTLPATFVIPASTGDALTAVTAPIVAFAMGRGGMRTWALALVWNALGLADLLNAVSRFPYGVDSQHSCKLLIRLHRRNRRRSLPHRRNRASRAQDDDGLLLGAVAVKLPRDFFGR